MLMKFMGRRRSARARLAARVTAVGLTAGTLVLTAGALTPVATAAERAVEPLPLSRHFDNVGISDDAHPSAADLDGLGQSLSAQDLTAAGWTPGRRLTINNTRLTWPDVPAGRPDNVISHGQAVAVGGHGDALTFLAAGTGGDAAGTGQIVHADGSRRPYSLTVPDWARGPLSTKAVALPHANSPAGQRETPVRLYALTVPLRAGEDLRAVLLPQPTGQADLHVFSLSLRKPARGWTGTWAASTSGYMAVGPWTNQTVRLVVHSSAGGPRTRIRLDNTFAARPVAIGRATVAVQDAGGRAAGQPVPLTFDGQPGTRIPAGGQAISDPAGFPLPPDTNLLVSVHLPGTVAAAPTHTATQQTSYITAPGSGDRTGDAAADAFTGTIGIWPFLTGVDVSAGPGSVLTLGDSITDGVGSTPGANRRWPNQLARRLLAQDEVPRFGVLNHGISANRVVTDRYKGDGVSADAGGVSAQHRLDRDVLSQTSARTVIVFEGINDVKAGTTAAEVIAGLRAIAARSRAHGLRVIVATVAPFKGWSEYSEAAEAHRQAVNAFIRDNGGAFDAVLDFDAVLRDPQDPQRLLPAYDTGDHLHPGDAGLKAAADSVDLRLLTKG